MRLLLFFRLIATLLPLLAFSGLAAEGANRSFVVRVRPEDYLDVEKMFPEPFSQSHELVVLKTTASRPISVLAVRRDPAADGYTVTLQLASGDSPGGWLKIGEVLDPALGQQILRAVELKLHRQVTLSKFKHTMSKTESDIWIYQRLTDGNIGAAHIAVADTFDNPAATVFVDELLGGLERSMVKEGEERAALLQKIDRIATDIVLVESR